MPKASASQKKRAKAEGESDLTKKANEILKMAEKAGVQSNFFFVTTFKRYQVQLEILDKLKQAIDSEDLLIEKEYVKGRPNLCANPAIGEYNKTSTAANSTVATLISIIKQLDTSLGESVEEKSIASEMKRLLGV